LLCPAELTLKLENETKRFTKKIDLEPNERRIVQISDADNQQFLIKNPKLWWPNKMGEPNLYSLSASISQQGVLSDSQTLNVGIRKIETFTNYYREDNHAEGSYYRVFKINGVPLLIRGAAWTDALLLNDTSERVRTELKYAKAMNLNTIRLEGFWGKDETIYETCDKLGLLIMIGWSAQWDWPLQGFRTKEHCHKLYGCYTTEEDQQLILASFDDQMRWLRNHPSVAIWMLGSDMKPLPQLEEKLTQHLRALNPDNVYILSAAEHISDFDHQPSGMKMRGPYIYVPPLYWFQNITEGGAFGFNTETAPGAEIPPLESLERMLELSSDYWPNTTPAWTYHLGGHPALQTLDRYDAAMKARYGEASNLQEYAQKAQLMNYESIRPMFEAFAAYRQGNPYLNGTPATGVIHWMLNAAWPKFFWQLFDYYLVPSSAYFSAREANKALHVLYNYADQSLYLNNDTPIDQKSLHVTARLWDTASNLLSTQHWTSNLKANNAIKLEVITVPKTLHTKVYFLDLTLNDYLGQELDKNVYWLSTQSDKLNSGTTILEYANFQELNKLPTAVLHIHYTLHTISDTNYKLTATIENPSDHIAFFNRFIVTSSTHPNGIIPIYWDDNFITVFPHETRVISAEFPEKSANIETFDLRIRPFNAQADISNN
jgi:exo-1,4-beta-D-glucosaminidase